MAELVWLIPAFPLFGFLTIQLFGRKMGDPLAGYFATLMVFASFAVAAAIYFDLVDRPEEDRAEVVTLFSWVPVGTLQIDLAFLADPLSITMCLFVTFIGGLIHLFAVGYMHGDPKFSKFFLYMNLFIVAMTVLVLGENLLVTFLGWEGVGTCSYFLIAFWHTRASAATAGKKAFVTNRVGDWGFMLAMFLTFGAVGSLSYSVLNNNAQSGLLSETTASAIAALLLIGAVGKSAQLPLYLWLPDAMEGPTPVSALIHAATMVTGGIFLLVRVNPVIAASYDWVPTLMAWTGAITALFAATIALAQNDIKRVLAYSTVSQIGYMLLAVGTGAYVAAIFHMVTHAAFKALLFLGSGSVIHGMHEEQDMRKMGMLRKFMPITAATFIVGWLAIAGVPPFAGFWSKDEILLFALAESTPLYIVGIVTALLTAFYMTRQVVMVFFGEAHWTSLANEDEAPEPEEGEEPAETHGAHGEFKPHESPPVMLIPLIVLAVMAFTLGPVQLPSFTGAPSEWQHKLQDWLHPVLPGEADISGTWAYDNKGLLALIAVACALIGIIAAWAVYQKKWAKPFEPALFEKGWYYDQAVTWFMGNPGRTSFEDTKKFDETVIDGAVEGSAVAVRETAGELRKGQTGFVRWYAALVTVGAVLLLSWFVVIRGIL
ncbi:MAG: NADH-quinone oxidoreductase subunit L [Ilumatobacteraceae bacterium]